MERSNSLFSGGDTDSVAAARRHSEASVASSNVTSATSGSLWSAVRLQAQRGRRASNNSKASSAATSAATGTSAGTQRRPRTFHFKVGTVSSDGSRTARQLPGLAPNTEVLYVNGSVGTRRNSAISNGELLY